MSEVVADVWRWKVDLPAGTLKGISETDARALADRHGGTVSRQRVMLLASRREVIDPWERVPQ